MATTPQQDADELGLERIVFFSDAVIAIAITLLALEIRLPEVHSGEEIPAALLSLWPRYLGFVVSFLVVGSYWFAHHRVFRAVRRYDDALIWLNILFLLCIAFVPFASAVLGEHGDERSAVLFYALVMMTTGLVQTLLWVYASRGHRLIDPNFSRRAIRFGTVRALTPPAVFVLSLPLMLVHAYAAIAAWALIYPTQAAIRRAEKLG
jgi:uncharacterized membrane protein